MLIFMVSCCVLIEFVQLFFFLPITNVFHGWYKVKEDKLKPLHREAHKLSLAFHQFTILHIPREENERADELANQALNSPYP